MIILGKDGVVIINANKQADWLNEKHTDREKLKNTDITKMQKKIKRNSCTEYILFNRM